MLETINELIARYPDVDLETVDHAVLVEIAHRYLSEERAKLYTAFGEKPRHVPDEGRAAVAIQTRTRTHQRKRNYAKRVERTMYDSESIDAMVSNGLQELSRHVLSTIRNDYTAILDVEFDLPDGGTVTWRTATVAQHRARSSFLKKQAGATLETAALHDNAVEVCIEAGADALGDVERQKAVTA